MKKTILSALFCYLFTASFAQSNKNQTSLGTAHWESTKKRAELISKNSTIIELEFGRKSTIVTFGNEKYEMIKKGFWCSQIDIMKNNELVASQNYVSLFSPKMTVEIGDKTYIAKSKHRKLSTTTYSNDNAEIVTYKLDGSKRKPLITYEIKASDIPEEHLLLLLAIGFNSIKNMSTDSDAAFLIMMIVS